MTSSTTSHSYYNSPCLLLLSSLLLFLFLFLFLFFFSVSVVSGQGVVSNCVLNETFCSCFVQTFQNCPVPTQTDNTCFLRPCTGYQCVETCDEVDGGLDEIVTCAIEVGIQVALDETKVPETGERAVGCSLQSVKMAVPVWVVIAPEYNAEELVTTGRALRIVGDTNTDLTGFQLIDAGDLNNDGYVDLAVGDVSGGKVYIIYGSENKTEPFGQTNELYLANINGSNGFYVEGAESLGRWIAAGDVNGDNIPDLVLSAPFADENSPNGGTLFVIFGVTSGTINNGQPSMNVNSLNGVKGFKIVSGPAPGTLTGLDVTVADVNRDGIADILIGSQRNIADSRTPDAFVVYGRASFGPVVDLSTLDGTQGFTIRVDTVAANQRSTIYIGAADFNGDGRLDIIAGNPLQNQLYIIYGRQQPFQSPFLISSLSQSTGLVVNGLESDSMGWVAKSGGDLNHDGIEDIVTSSYNTNRVYVIFGRSASSSPLPFPFDTSSLDGTHGFFIQSNAGNFGFDLAGGGDVNGDGIDDLIIGANYEFTQEGQSGRIYGFYGQHQSPFQISYDITRLTRQEGFLINGLGDFAPPTALTTQFGRFVNLGDWDQDGINDILVAAPAEVPAGASYIFRGDASSCRWQYCDA